MIFSLYNTISCHEHQEKRRFSQVNTVKFITFVCELNSQRDVLLSIYIGFSEVLNTLSLLPCMLIPSNQITSPNCWSYLRYHGRKNILCMGVELQGLLWNFPAG